MKRRKGSNKSSAKRFKQYLPIPIEIVHYPCAGCNTEAITNAVECSSCKSWTHASCLNLCLKEWDSNDIDFFCSKCVFKDFAYDFNAALF